MIKMGHKLKMPHLPPPDYQLKKIEYMQAIILQQKEMIHTLHKIDYKMGEIIATLKNKIDSLPKT